MVDFQNNKINQNLIQLLGPNNWIRGGTIGIGRFGTVINVISKETGEKYALKEIPIMEDVGHYILQANLSTLQHIF